MDNILALSGRDSCCSLSRHLRAFWADAARALLTGAFPGQDPSNTTRRVGVDCISHSITSPNTSASGLTLSWSTRPRVRAASPAVNTHLCNRILTSTASTLFAPTMFRDNSLAAPPKAFRRPDPPMAALRRARAAKQGAKGAKMGCAHGWGCNFRRRALNMCVGVHFAGDTMTRLGTRWGRPAAPGNAGSRRRRAPWSPMRTRFCLSFLSRKWLAISARHGRGASFHNPCLNRSLQLFAVSVPYSTTYSTTLPRCHMCIIRFYMVITRL